MSSNLSKLLRAQQFQGSGVATPLEWLLGKLRMISLVQVILGSWSLENWADVSILFAMGGLSSSSDVRKMSRIIHLPNGVLNNSYEPPFYTIERFSYQYFTEIFLFPSCFVQLDLSKLIERFSLIKSVSIIWRFIINFKTDQEDGQFWASSWHSRYINNPWCERGRIHLSYFLDPKLIWCSSPENQKQTFTRATPEA